MRAAPAIDYPLACSGFWRGGASLCASAAGAALFAWGGSWLQAGALQFVLLALSGALLGAVLGWCASRGKPGRLVWNGQSWLLVRPAAALPEPGTPEMALDWGDWMLVRWHAGPKGRTGWAPGWLALERRVRPHAWHGLRVALHASSPVAGVAP